MVCAALRCGRDFCLCASGFSFFHSIILFVLRLHTSIPFFRLLLAKQAGERLTVPVGAQPPCTQRNTAPAAAGPPFTKNCHPPFFLPLSVSPRSYSSYSPTRRGRRRRRRLCSCSSPAGARHSIYNAGHKAGKDLHVSMTCAPKRNMREIVENLAGAG